ncbi:MAG: leucine-rich repeat protein, partial [Agathobacter sp.]|nr:leucine-rich repeat protein [Agathobacter sp.]
DYNFPNNTELSVKITGLLDYGEDGGASTNLNNVIEFPLTVDFEAPTVTDVKYTYEYDKTLGKNRLYAEVAVYDNHYAMAAQFGFVKMGADENDNPMPEIELFEQYLTPIYSQRNGTTYVKYELTDYIYNIKENAINDNSFVVTTYDYALNYATYEIGLPDDFSDFYFDGLEEEVTLSVNEVLSLEPLVEPATEWSELLQFTSSKPSVVRVVNNKLVAVKKGTALVKVADPTTNKNVTFKVTVLDESDEGYTRFDKPVADIFSLNGYYTTKAYYMLDSSDKLIGDTGSTNFFDGNYSLSMYPSESVYLMYTLDAYFPNDTTVEFESSDESIVSIDPTGQITAVAEGFASVTIKVLMDDKSTYYSETVSVEVKDPYVTTGASLTHYYGNGGLVVIPEDLKLTSIGAFAFSNFDYVAKTPEELEFDDREMNKQWYIGESTITKVIIPEGVEKIDAYAFANLVALEEVVFPSTLESIEYGAFVGCSSLKKITFSGEDNVVVINQSAFEGCALEGTLEWKSVNVISNYAFAGNSKLEELVLGENVISIGSYAFAGCQGLEKVSIASDKVKYGTYAFTGCKSLTDFYVNAAVLPEGMFYECEKLESVTIGPDVNDIGEFAFRDTNIKNFVIDSGNKTYKVQNENYIVSADGKTLVAVSPLVSGKLTKEDIGNHEVTALATGALSNNTEINSVVLPKVTEIGNYGLASNKHLDSYEFGNLEKIGEYAFFETGIKELPVFTKDTQIGKYAFAFTQITSVVIPDEMVIEEGVFSECMKLESVVIGDNVTLGKFAFAVDKDNSYIIKDYNENKDKFFYYDFATSLNNVVIGENAIIGDHAFAYAASLESVILGAGATIGYMGFYGTQSLKEIDLSKVISIGDYAFSGDVYNVCIDENMAYAAVSKDGNYIYTYHGPKLTQIDLSSAESIGEHAFSYCRELTTVVLGEQITEVPQYAFAGDVALEDINLDQVETIGEYAFMESGLTKVDLSSVEEIGKYAFVYLLNLEDVILNPEGSKIEEGAFAYCEELEEVENLNAVESIGDYAFAYTAITKADLTGAEHVGTHAFLKEELTPFSVTLGEDLESLGDNPFGMCQLDPFYIMGVEEINEREIEVKVYTFDISDTVKVVDGSLYSKVDTGWELITYAGINSDNVKIPEDTVRISSMAFAGSDVVMVELPYTTTAIGHKAFHDCQDLEIVIFGSFTAPILEEEYDPTYYDALESIPGSGDYGTYIDYDGSEVVIKPLGIIP